MEIIKKIKANFVQIVEVLILIIVIFLPYMLDIPSWFVAYLKHHKPEPDIGDFLPYYILKTGNMAIISLSLLFVTLIAIRRYNKEFIMNNDNVYHNYPYVWY